MKIVNSIMPMNDIEALAANGQKLRVAVTKTSAQGKAAQSATPNLMSFSTDENSVWFNGKKYGVHKFSNVSSLNTNSTAEQVLSALNVSKSSELYDLAHKGVLFIDTISGNTIVKYEDGDDTFQLYVPSSDSRSIKKLTITVSSNKVTGLTTISHLIVDDIKNTLTSTETNKALSAAMGKALNDRINGLGSPYKVKGTKTNISDVLSLTDAKVGDVWKVTNEFTLGGKKYPAGTNVVCVTATSPSDHNDDNWDALGGTVDLTPYLTKSDASNTYAKKADTDTSFDEIWEQLGVVVAKDEIVNNLTSSETNKPLSAAMGKKLQDEKLAKSDVVNNLTTTDASKALSAAQGKALNDRISGLGNVYRVKGTKTNLSDVLALTDAKVGDVWNVTNAFTLGGKPYPANTNVVCITATSSSDHDEGNWDPLGGTVNLSTYVPKSDIVDNLSTSDSKKPLSAKQGLALAAMITELEDDKETYQLLKTFESSTPSSQGEVDAILGPYSSFNAALNASKIIHGIYKDGSNRLNTVAFSAFNDTTANRVRMYAILDSSTMVAVLANHNGTNWISATIDEGPLGGGITIE